MLETVCEALSTLWHLKGTAAVLYMRKTTVFIQLITVDRVIDLFALRCSC